MLVFLQFDAERLAHGRDSSGKNDGPACRALLLHREFVFAGKGLDASDAFRVRPMALLEFFAAQDRYVSLSVW